MIKRNKMCFLYNKIVLPSDGISDAIINREVLSEEYININDLKNPFKVETSKAYMINKDQFTIVLYLICDNMDIFELAKIIIDEDIKIDKINQLAINFIDSINNNVVWDNIASKEEYSKYKETAENGLLILMTMSIRIQLKKKRKQETLLMTILAITIIM